MTIVEEMGSALGIEAPPPRRRGRVEYRERADQRGRQVELRCRHGVTSALVAVAVPQATILQHLAVRHLLAYRCGCARGIT